MGDIVATTGHEDAIVYANVDPTLLEKARAGIPVTVQRRFDVYPDVSA